MKNKRVIFQDVWKVEICEDELNESLSSSEVLVKTHYSLISAGTELACLAGKESAWFKYPRTPGYSSVGEIVACSDNVENLKIGDIVFCYGSHAAYNKVDTKNAICTKLIDGLDEKLATYTRLANVAMTAIRSSEIELGDYVGVTGLGVVGNMAAQLAKAQGAFVVGMDIDEERINIANETGIGRTATTNSSDFKQQVLSLTEDNGLSCVIEATGLSSVAVGIVDVIAKNGELILLGSPRDEYVTDATAFLKKFHVTNSALRLKPAHEWIYPVKINEFAKHSSERNTSIVFNLIKEETLKIKPLISHVIKPEDAPKAYEAFKNREKGYVGVVIDWNI